MILYLFNLFLNIMEVLCLIAKCVAILFHQVRKIFVTIPRKSVDGKIILITGAGSGVGRELAIRFIELGAILVIWDYDKQLLDESTEEIRRRGGTVYPMHVDVSDEKSVEESAEEVRQRVGIVYMLINNAGICPVVPFNNLTYQEIRRTFDVNILGHFWTLKQFLPDMEKHEGHIVAIASSAGIMGSSYFTAYGASKYGVVGLMACLDKELYETEKRNQIKMTTICPLGISGTRIDIPTRTRFPKILPIMKLDYAVDLMLDAILKDEEMVVIPFTFRLLYFVNRLFPMKISQLLFEFLDYAVEPHGYNAPRSRSHYHDPDYKEDPELNHLKRINHSLYYAKNKG